MATGIVCKLDVVALERVHQIELLTNTVPWSKALLEAEFSQPHARIYGIRGEGMLVGFIICHIVLDEAHIMGFGVDPAFQGRGYGKTLLNELITDLAQEGVQSISLEVRKSNTAAFRLYTSANFSEIGVRSAYYTDNNEDALLLRLLIRGNGSV